MKVSAERGDAAGGQQFTTVTVISTTTCQLPGTPAVHTTDAAGRLLVVAKPGLTGSPLVTLTPGRPVTSRVYGPTTCNAPVSVYLVVTPSTAVGASRLLVPLRACGLTVDHYRG